MREPSRRAVVAGAGVALTGLGSAAASGLDAAGVGRAAPADRAWPARTSDAAVQDSTSGTSTDWPMPRYDPPCTGHAPGATGPTDDVGVAWRTPLEQLWGASGPPIAVGDTIYVAGDGALVAVDAASGDRRFVRTGPYRTPPARAKSRVYRTDVLAVADGTSIHAVNEDGGLELPLVDVAIGSRRWTAELAREPRFTFGFEGTSPPPVAAGNSVYASPRETDRLVALDADDGRVRWSATPDRGQHDGVRRPAVRAGSVFATTEPGQTVAAFDVVDGSELWRRELSVDPVDDRARPTLAPVATESGVLVPWGRGLTRFDADSGEVEWERAFEGRLHGESTAAVAEGTAFLATERDPRRLHAIDLATGEDEWTADGVGGTAPVVADDVLYVADDDRIRAFDAATGDELFGWAGEFVQGQPIVANERLYAVDGRDLVALEEA